MTPLLPVLFAGVYGLAIGSFLNVCSIRWPLDESVVSPRSRCPQCARPIRWTENVPLVSWLMLGGKCAGCGLAISIQYPLVELATGVIWAGSVWMFGLEWEAVRSGLFLTILLGVALSDARFYIIPDQFSIGGAVLGVAMAFLPGGIEWSASLVGAAAGAVGLWTVGWLTTKYLKWRDPERMREVTDEMGVESALGFGDVKLMAMIGAFVGPSGVLVTVFLGSVLGLLIFGPISWYTKRPIPFGIFLALGGAAAWGWGEALITWYTGAVLGG